MDRNRNGIAAVVLLFFIVADVSNADVAPPVNSTAIPVSPSPVPGEKSDLKPNNKTDAPIADPKVSPPPLNNPTVKENKNPKDSNKTDTVTVAVSPPPQNNTDNGPKKTNNRDTVSPPPQKKETKDTVSPPPQKKTENDEKVSPPPEKKTENDGKNNGTKDKEESENNKNSLVLEIGQNCTGMQCRDEKALVACIESYESESKQLVVLVQNGGEETLEVKLTVSSSDKNPLKELKIPQHHTERINISLATGRNTKLILNAGHGECLPHLNPSVSEGTFFLRLPSYDKLVTPINGAYFLILTGVIFGGTWACCKFRKRRRQGGVPYQELEMGLPESVSATDVETAEGWDQGWDDDWDEDNAVKSPGGRRVGSISANGLTSRSSNKNGWENDWDD